jgi:hypothetical protein
MKPNLAGCHYLKKVKNKQKTKFFVFSLKKINLKKALCNFVHCNLLYPHKKKFPKKKISRQSYQPFEF